MSTELVSILYQIAEIILILSAIKITVFMCLLIARSSALAKALRDLEFCFNEARTAVIVAAPKPPKIMTSFNSCLAFLGLLPPKS